MSPYRRKLQMFGNALAVGRALWGRLPFAARDRAVAGAIWLRAAARWAWLSLLALLTVWTDPCGRARAPLRAAAVGARPGAEVFLLTAKTPRELRLAAFFWRHYGAFTRQDLLWLATRHGVPRGRFDLAGAVVYAKTPRGTGDVLPVAFELQIDLVAGKLAVRHSSPAGRCAHSDLPITLNAVGLGDVLKVLLGRGPCAPKSD